MKNRKELYARFTFIVTITIIPEEEIGIQKKRNERTNDNGHDDCMRYECENID